MIGTIDFRHDAARDLVFVTPHWTVESHDDVLVWYEQYSGARHDVAAQTDEVSTLEEAVKVIEAKRQGSTSTSG